MLQNILKFAQIVQAKREACEKIEAAHGEAARKFVEDISAFYAHSQRMRPLIEDGKMDDAREVMAELLAFHSDALAIAHGIKDEDLITTLIGIAMDLVNTSLESIIAMRVAAEAEVEAPPAHVH